MAGSEDWRLQGQESYLKGATLVRKRYRTRSDEWEHDHCEFCWAEFMDPDYSPEHREFVKKANPHVLTEGYAVQARDPGPSSAGVMGRTYVDDPTTIHPKPASADTSEYWWICPTCAQDFAKRFEWVVID